MGIYWLALVFYGLYSVIILLSTPSIPSKVKFKTFDSTGNILEYSLKVITKFITSLYLIIVGILSIKGVLNINIYVILLFYLICHYGGLYLISNFEFKIVNDYDYEKDVSRYTRSGEIIPDILEKSDSKLERKDVTNTYKTN